MTLIRKRTETAAERRQTEPSLEILGVVPDGWQAASSPWIGDLRDGRYLQRGDQYFLLSPAPTPRAGWVAPHKPPKAIDGLLGIPLLDPTPARASGSAYKEGRPAIRGRAIVDAYRRKGYTLSQSTVGGLYVEAPGGIDTYGASSLLARPGAISFLLAMVAGSPLPCAAPGHEGPEAEAVTVGLGGTALCGGCVKIANSRPPADARYWSDGYAPLVQHEPPERPVL